MKLINTNKNGRNVQSGFIYHVYNRGNRALNIFHKEHDKMRFLMLMHVCNNTDTSYTKFRDKKPNEIFSIERKPENELCEIGAYCLLDNHFHFALKEKEQGGIAKFMMRLANAYTQYFNFAYGNKGSIFQGKYKLKHTSTDAYYRSIITYIHLNPIWKHEYRDILEDPVKFEEIFNKAVMFNFSSFHDLVFGSRFQRTLLNTKNFPDLYNKIMLLDDVRKWLLYRAEYDFDTF